MKIGDRLAENYARMARLQRNPGELDGRTLRSVKGADNLDPDPHYVPHHWDAQRLVLLREDFVDDVPVQIIANGIRGANPHISEEAIQRTAKAFVRAIVNRAHGLEDIGRRAIGLEDMTTLTDILVEHGNLPKEDAAAILAQFRRADDAGREPAQVPAAPPSR